MTPLARLLTCRYLLSNRQHFISLLSLVAVVGMALSVSATILVTGVLFGFQRELNKNLVGLHAHITLRDVDAALVAKIKTLEGVETIEPVIDGEVLIRMASGKEGQTTGGQEYVARLRGVEKISPVLKERFKIAPQTLENFTMAGGEELLMSLGIYPGFQGSVTLVYPFGEIGPLGDWVPRQKEIVLSHVFRTGLYDWDAYQLLVPLSVAQNLLGEQGRRSFQIRLHDFNQIEKRAVQIGKILPTAASMETFATQNERLFAALKLERVAMITLLGLFILISGFSVTGLLFLFIGTKRRDMAVLQAIGLAKKEMQTIFKTMGFLLGGVGSLIGLGFGCGALLILQRYPIQLPSTYYLEALPVQIDPLQIAILFMSGLFLTWIATALPVRQASQFPMLELLREE